MNGMHTHVNVFIALFCNTLVVLASVMLHYEALRYLSALQPRLTFLNRRARVLVGLLGALFTHVIEVWLFGLAFYFLSGFDGFGKLANSDGSLMDCVYFSIVSYTSLGYGDLYATEHLRFLAGVEALTGLLLVGWSSSLTFIWMQKYWREKKKDRKKK